MFSNATFITSAQARGGFVPDRGLEVAFVGRSNAGKSSAINKLLNRRSLARTSKTPGRTQLVNFFQVGEARRVVDLPGYGFAQVPDRVRRQWRGLMTDYFQDRSSLQGVVLLMDIRRGMTEFDRQMLNWIGPQGHSCHILLTKSDKLKRQAQTRTLAQVRHILDEDFGSFPIDIQLFSAHTGLGLSTARERLGDWLNFPKKLAPAS